ncbi:MAG TPA: SapC family protein [Rhizomicrobium sp.]|nr:SapC family protein [Rhizomicrobium sp.]
MPNIVLLNNQVHRALKVQPGAAARFGDNQRFVAVILGEFPHLVAHYPILLTKDANTGGFILGAMLGFDEGENLFLTSRGMDSYRPLNMQRGCFFTAADQVAIDLDSPRIGEDGVALFDDKGEPTTYTQSIMALFRDLVRGTEQTRQFTETLMQLKLLEPVDINASFDDGTRRTFTGLYTINQNNLRALPDAQVLELFRNGYLQLIHLMIASLKQVGVLAQMKNRALAGAA